MVLNARCPATDPCTANGTQSTDLNPYRKHASRSAVASSGKSDTWEIDTGTIRTRVSERTA